MATYKVNKGHSFVGKGRMYKAGNAITADVFGDKKVFASFVSKGFIVQDAVIPETETSAAKPPETPAPASGTVDPAPADTPPNPDASSGTDADVSAADDASGKGKKNKK
jgi:hypothetical protein